MGKRVSKGFLGLQDEGLELRSSFHALHVALVSHLDDLLLGLNHLVKLDGLGEVLSHVKLTLETEGSHFTSRIGDRRNVFALVRTVFTCSKFLILAVGLS